MPSPSFSEWRKSADHQLPRLSQQQPPPTVATAALIDETIGPRFPTTASFVIGWSRSWEKSSKGIARENGMRLLFVVLLAGCPQKIQQIFHEISHCQTIKSETHKNKLSPRFSEWWIMTRLVLFTCRPKQCFAKIRTKKEKSRRIFGMQIRGGYLNKKGSRNWPKIARSLNDDRCISSGEFMVKNGHFSVLGTSVVSDTPVDLFTAGQRSVNKWRPMYSANSVGARNEQCLQSAFRLDDFRTRHGVHSKMSPNGAESRKSGHRLSHGY